ncbi:hypothetical protein [Parvularcula marina]|uniref:Uncharacterized protein n=1 Tax=Parvularcula marina TaxID=2292771 RepID=A0A371RF44_9PROT|nr:hypothetical protein [Parvularcula marina]RFB04063.1 hypothetical protein DX908_01450 [Parvularcula marina]
MRHLFSGFLAIAIIAMVGVGLWQKNGGEFELPSIGEASLTKQAANIEKAATKAVDAEAAGEAELRRVADAVSGMFATSFGGFTEGAATDVKITIAGFPDAGLSIDELSLYGADADAIESVVNGGEWTELRIADRIDAKGIELFGLNEVVELFTMQMMGLGPAETEESYALAESQAEAIEEMEELTDGDLDLEMADEPSSDAPFTINEYKFAIDRLVIDGMTLYPLSGSAEDDGSPMAIVAKVADIYRASSYECSAVWNMVGQFDFETPEIAMDIEFSSGFSGATGWMRGDLENTVATDIAMEMTQHILFLGDDGITNSSQTVKANGWRDMKLATLLGYLADGALPPMTETDVLSLGVLNIEGQVDKSNGEIISTMDSLTLDLSSFHWLMPTAVGVEVDGLMYDVPVLLDSLLSTMSMGTGGLDEEEQALYDQVIAIVEEQGLTKPVVDLDLALSWNPEDGATAYDVDATLREGMRKVVDVDVVLPNYERISTAVMQEDGSQDWSAVEGLFEEDLAFGGFYLSLEDIGLLEDIFAMVPKFAALIPAEDNPQAGMIAAQSPEALRQMISGLMRAGATQVASEFPPAVGYVNAIADFVAEGGTLVVAVQPPAAPLKMDDIEALVSAPDATPDSIVEGLGVRVEQSGTDDEV